MDKTEAWDRQVAVRDVTLRFLGISPRVEALRGAIAKVAQSHAPVLVRGEIGTGKELVARLIHDCSSRADGSFVAISGSAVTPALEIGAASGGTLFIHEVGDLSAEAQTALLLYLQRRDGDDNELAVRLLCSTHADLEQRSHVGEFREDLYYRIASLQLEVPPLRERGPDISLMAQHLLDDFSAGRELRFDEQAIRALAVHAWPGNVRELRNRVLQASVMCEGTDLTAELLGLGDRTRYPRVSAGSSVSLREIRHTAEREAIIHALRECHGQVPAAAAALGISRAQLYRLIGRLQVDHHLEHDVGQNGISSSGKGSSLRAAGAGEPDPLRSPP